MRKYLLAFLLTLFAIPAMAQYQSSNFGIGWKVANLPLATGSKGQFWPVMDGTSASDCSTGGGSTAVLCESSGTAWVAVSGGGSYTLPAATSSVLGGVKPDGTSILNTAGAISATPASVGACALSGCTMTGTLTGSDAGTWSSTGISSKSLTATTGTTPLIASVGSTYAATGLQINNGDNIYIGLEGPSPGTFLNNSTAYSGVFSMGSSHPLQFGTGGTLGMTLDASNNFCVGATFTTSCSSQAFNVTAAGAATAAGVINTTTPIRDQTRFVLAANMTAVATAGVQIGSTGAGNSIFSWPVTAANWYDLRCQLPTTFATTATIRFELVSISGSVTISNVNAETMGDTGAAGVFQNLATIAGTSLAGSETPATGAPGASEQITYDTQFLTSHAGNIGIEFVANGTNNVTMLLGGECGITQIN